MAKPPKVLTTADSIWLANFLETNREDLTGKSIAAVLKLVDSARPGNFTENNLRHIARSMEPKFIFLRNRDAAASRNPQLIDVLRMLAIGHLNQSEIQQKLDEIESSL